MGQGQGLWVVAGRGGRGQGVRGQGERLILPNTIGKFGSRGPKGRDSSAQAIGLGSGTQGDAAGRVAIVGPAARRSARCSVSRLHGLSVYCDRRPQPRWPDRLDPARDRDDPATLEHREPAPDPVPMGNREWTRIPEPGGVRANLWLWSLVSIRGHSR